MAKVNPTLILLLLLMSCAKKEHYTTDKYNIQLIYNPWITIDLNSKTIKIDFENWKRVDTMVLSKKEEALIIKSFDENGIYEIVGDVSYHNEYITMPPNDLQIKIIYKGKQKSKITIDHDYNVKAWFPFDKRNRIVRFRNDVLCVLNKNKEFIKASKAVIKYQEEHHIFLL